MITSQPEHALRLPDSDSPLSVILKLPGETCNINCYYCYEKRKPYPDHQRLSPELLRRFLAACGARSMRIELHGGEPLLLPRDHMAALLAEVRRYPGEISLSIQTNGLLLDNSWLDFFEEQWPDIEIGVSHDGPADLNDRYRVDYSDAGTSAQVDECLRRLEERGTNVGVGTVVTQAALGNAGRIVEYFSEFPAVKFLKFSPCLDYDAVTTALARGNRKNLLLLNGSGEGTPGWATTPLEYADFVIEAFEAWRAGAYQRFVIEPLYSIIRVLAGRNPSFCHYSETKCSYVLTLYPDGRVGSCDELRMPDAQLIEISSLEDVEDITRLQTNPELHARLDGLYEKCSTCSYRTTCRGGCLATRLVYEGTPFDDEYCAHRAKLIDYVADQLADLEIS